MKFLTKEFLRVFLIFLIGTVISSPPDDQKPFPNSEYELTSIMSTAYVIPSLREISSENHSKFSSTFFAEILLGGKFSE